MIIDDDKYILRKACDKDIPFLADVIIEAEMSGTNNCGLANLYGLSIPDLRKYIINILGEGIDGCEFSLSNFLVVEYEGEPVAAGGGWREGFNEDGLPSAILKANLIAYYIPKENILYSQEKLHIAKELQIVRENGAYQMEFAFVKKEHQGHFLYNWIFEELIKEAKEKYPDMHKVQGHVFEANKAVPLLLKMMGFHITERFVSNNSETKKYYPDNVILLMEMDV